MNILFFGSSENSLIVLKALKQADFKIKLVITAPPRPAGRKQQITKTPIHLFAQNYKIPLLTPKKLDQTALKEIKKTKPDVAIVADYAKKIPKEILNIPKHGFLNLHPSLLPQYRGSTPTQNAILNGDKVTGLTIYKMDEQFDHGPIISLFKEEIRQPVYTEGIRGDTSQTLYRRLFKISAEVLTTILPSWIKGNITPREQDHSLATYAPRLTRNDGFIPWPLIQKAISTNKNTSLNDLAKLKQASPLYDYPINRLIETKEKNLNNALSEIIERAVRALYPWPGIWTTIPTTKGEKRLKILSTQIENNKLILQKVQLAGQQPSTFNQIKNQISSPKAPYITQ